MATHHVDVAEAPQAEYTQLRKPDVAAKLYWGTTIFKGSPLTFRVLDDADMTPVDSTVYLNARLQEMHKQVQNACIHRAAELAYRSVPVEVSILDDPLAVPSAMDCAVDLWLPLHVALMTGNKLAVQTLLQFHVEHAVDAMTCFANTPSKVGTVKEMEFNAVSRDSSVLRSLGDETGEEEEESVNEATKPAAAATIAVPTSLTFSDRILDCQVRRELGGTVILLGHFDGRIRHSSSAAVRKSRAPSPVLSAGNSVANSLSALPVIPIPPPISGYSDANISSAVPPPGSAEDLLIRSVTKYNEALLEEETALFEDKGEEYCLLNVLTALRPLLQSVVLEIERRWQWALPGSKKVAVYPPPVPESAIDILRDFCLSLAGQPQHPPLLVDNNLLFELCHHGDLMLLSKVLDAFEGALTPVLRGQDLLTDRQNGGSGAGTAAGTAGMPTTSSRDPSPHLSSLTTAPASAIVASSTSPSHHSPVWNQGSHSVATTPRGSCISRHLHSSTPTSFWWSCRPQQVHLLAFTALWIGCREAVEESSGSGRRRRAVTITSENRVMMTTIRQLVESPVAAQKLSSTIWSGHLVTITKLLSRDCALEDFIDFVEEGGYFSIASPSGFSGPFLSLLVSGVMAAAVVRDAATLRVLRRKVETLLVDVPGRPSSLRTYVLGKPLTHAERFRELWLDAGSHHGNGANSQPMVNGERPIQGDGAVMGTARLPHKFRTRVELLYYAVVEQVLVAAEEAWTQKPEDAQCCPAGASPTSLWAGGSAQKEALAALQSWLHMWTNFFTALRDRPSHRRSLSHSSASSQVTKDPQQQLNSSMDGSLGREKNTPHMLPVAAPSVHDTSIDDLLGEDTNEVAETIRQVCRALVDRLETGDEPLPTLRRALYPNGVNEADGVVSGSATPAQVDKALPMSSIDQEFTAAARAFGSMAAKESQEVQLKFYGLYKQATKGDVNISRPGFFDYAGKAKWDAWSKLKGMSLLDAKRAYVGEYKMMIDLRKAKQ
ncbi:putative acyl-CoA binding protein [Leptomonas seymouri]|uniref:Putative acyl-CoA binding protein n=1 Tax=Leptomonas seymouri TaxID=5684 RepID=A0A0N1I7G9_LEPSE|nr:putative acyl-CoA binding protein [Leptomonas seymouri]|eukprot:KPI88415.1 putative acyl-CoA binding protein [Leptomonas seymouri]